MTSATESTTITDERAVRRFHQMARIERAIVLQLRAMDACKAHLKELTEEYVGLLQALRNAARDEGELPLFRELD
jgi:hypothetical protein